MDTLMTATTDVEAAPCASCGKLALLTDLDLALAEAGVPAQAYCARCLLADAEALCTPEVAAQVRDEVRDRAQAEADLRAARAAAV